MAQWSARRCLSASNLADAHRPQCGRFCSLALETLVAAEYFSSKQSA